LTGVESKIASTANQGGAVHEEPIQNTRRCRPGYWDLHSLGRSAHSEYFRRTWRTGTPSSRSECTAQQGQNKAKRITTASFFVSFLSIYLCICRPKRQNNLPENIDRTLRPTTIESHTVDTMAVKYLGVKSFENPRFLWSHKREPPADSSET